MDRVGWTRRTPAGQRPLFHNQSTKHTNKKASHIKCRAQEEKEKKKKKKEKKSKARAEEEAEEGESELWIGWGGPDGPLQASDPYSIN